MGADWGLYLFLLATVAVGWLLASRVPGNPIGWLLLAIAGLFLAAVPAALLGHLTVPSHPAIAAWLPPVGLMFTQLLLLFPDGRLPSAGWRRFQRFALAAVVFGSAMLAMVDSDVAPGVANPIGWIYSQNSLMILAVFAPLLASFAGSAWSLVWRYRHASDQQRSQIKVVAFASAFTVALYLVTLVAGWSSEADIWHAIVAAAYSLIPISIGIAVLRYRLYEIDRVISRTVAYTLVTAVVIATYALVVTSVSRLLPVSNALAVTVATLAAAAIFRPALTWLRNAVNRRFDRARFDAAREIEAYAERVRDQVDPITITADLAQVVQRTLSPATLGIWTPTAPLANPPSGPTTSVP